MLITIHQPEHLPWLGFFHKINQADTFVILDSVQFRKNYFQNRNKIRTVNGWSWLTVPVKKNLDTIIKDVKIDNTKNTWRKKCWDSIFYSYKKAPFFDSYSPEFESIFQTPWENLCEMNITIIKKVLKMLSLEPEILRSSEMGINEKGSDLILNICKKTGAATYISGISGKDYLKPQDFRDAGINVTFQEFYHPIYRQMYEPFISCMSVLDLLFNHGEKSMDIINGTGAPVMKELFL